MVKQGSLAFFERQQKRREGRPLRVMARRKKESRAALLARLKRQRKKAKIGEFAPKRKRASNKKKKRATTARKRRSPLKTVSRSKSRVRTKMAKKKRKGRSRRTGEKIDIMAIVATGVVEGTVDGVINSFVPNVGLPADALQAVVGWLVAKKVAKRGLMHKVAKYYTIANGVSAVKQLVPVGSLIGGLGR